MYSSSTSVRYKFEWLCASNLHLQFLIPWPLLSIVESEKDVLEVTIRATALVPLLDSIADSLHATVVQIRVIRVSPEDFQSDLLRHLCLDLLPCAEADVLFFNLDQEAIRVLAFLQLEAKSNTPATIFCGPIG